MLYVIINVIYYCINDAYKHTYQQVCICLLRALYIKEYVIYLPMLYITIMYITVFKRFYGCKRL